MIKNIIFDIGNVILKFDIDDVLNRFTGSLDERKFILDNIINSPEWLRNGLIDTGYIQRDDAIKIVQDRTNHTNDMLIEKFWTTYNDYAMIDDRILEIIREVKKNNYKVYLLSNINPYTHELLEKSDLLDLVDGYVFSYKEHMIKPFDSIYYTLINRYSLKVEESLFIDDNQNNIDTGSKLGLISRRVDADNYNSVVEVLNEYSIYKKST